MPLVKRRVENALAYPSPLWAESPPESVLADVHQAQMVGALTQLGHLAGHAADMFNDMFREADGIQQRMIAANGRVAGLIDALPVLEQQVAGATMEEILAHDSPHVERAVDESSAKFRLTHATLPPSLKARYEASDIVEPPPDFGGVDAILLPDQRAPDGAPCSNKFSDPKVRWRAPRERSGAQHSSGLRTRPCIMCLHRGGLLERVKR